MDNLPPPNTQRWVVRRKAAVLAAVRNGDITVEEARSRYGLSQEELQAWERGFDADGLSGLRATRVVAHRTRPRR
jgi:ribosomal protein S19E (S16A)